MSKKKKKRRSFIPESETKSAVKKSLAELNWKLLGKVALYFVIVFAVYKLGLKIADIYNSQGIMTAVVVVYVAVTTVLCGVFIIMNRGMSNDIPTKSQLRDDMSDAEKEKFISDLIESKRKAKKILPILIAFVFTLLIDMLYLLFL